MKRGVEECGGGRWTRAMLLLVAASLFGAPPPADAGDDHSRIVHVVLVWLKEPGNPQHRSTIIETTRRLVETMGVEELRVGEPLPSARAMVDDSFDIGLYMIFDSPEGLARYLEHPAHKEAVTTVLRPLSLRTVVYDFLDESPVR